MARIRKGDKVQIRVGKDRGKSGAVAAVDAKRETVFLPGLNLYKKHKRPTRQGQKGEIISVARAIPAANVQLVCGGCGQPARVGFRFEGAAKIRYCKKCRAAV